MQSLVTKFHNALGVAFGDVALEDGGAHPSQPKVFLDALRSVSGIENASLPSSHSLNTVKLYSDQMLSAMSQSPLTDCVRSISPALRWYQVFDSNGIEDALAQGLVAGQIIGKNGIIYSASTLMGLFLIAPGVKYPFHQHPALELYYVLSGSIRISHGRGKALERFTANQYSITPPHQVHSLETGDEPCLILYVWTGDMTPENWWWVEDNQGNWHRQCWQRQLDGSWGVTHSEPLSLEAIRRGGDSE